MISVLWDCKSEAWSQYLYIPHSCEFLYYGAHYQCCCKVIWVFIIDWSSLIHTYNLNGPYTNLHLQRSLLNQSLNCRLSSPWYQIYHKYSTTAIAANNSSQPRLNQYGSCHTTADHAVVTIDRCETILYPSSAIISRQMQPATRSVTHFYTRYITRSGFAMERQLASGT